jgi:hypothetical protein
MAKELFYSESDKKLFYIAGYGESTDNIHSIISTLENLSNHFKMITGVKTNVINTLIVRKSRRYKEMRVIYCDIDETCEKIPDAAFRLTKENDWDMYKWLED